MSVQASLSPRLKALNLNLEDSIYGTFAEIGAGQEVVRHFFQAGKASRTIAKTMSAYDMAFSDTIYGKSDRYVSEARLIKMLDHEFELLKERLGETRGDTTQFFAFADTVATHSSEDDLPKSHGWLGVRFQTRPGGPANDIVLHVRMWDRLRLQQQEAVGVLGVNLIHLAYFPPTQISEVVNRLMDHLSSLSIEIDMLRFDGPDLEHIDNRLVALELVRQQITEAVMFDPDGEVCHVDDCLFKTPVLVHRGTFRPITSANQEIVERSLKHFASLPQNKGQNSKVVLEMTMGSLSRSGQIDTKDFLERVDTLGLLKHYVLISNHNYFYQLKAYLRRSTDQMIGMVIGGGLLEKLFDESFYTDLKGGILEGFSRLFDENATLFVYPYKSDSICLTSQSFFPKPPLQSLMEYLRSTRRIVDLLNCDDVDTSLHSEDVRALLDKKDPKWEDYVPKEIKDLIISKKFFGF